MTDLECTKVYIVMNNTDLTEGRGAEYPFAVAEFESTAQRIAKGAYVQGMNCPIFEENLVIIDGVKYLPVNRVPFVIATSADIEKEKENVEKRKRKILRQIIIQKALDAGLSEEDVGILQNNT